MKKFKTEMKKQAKNGLVYWAEWEGNSYIGSRHFIIRVQFVPDNLRAVLAEVGLFAPNTAKNQGVDVKVSDGIHKLIDGAADGAQAYMDTRLKYTTADKKPMTFRVLKDTNTGKFILSNDDLYEAVAEFFNYPPISGKGGVNPIVFGNNLGLVLPYRAKGTELSFVQFLNAEVV